MRKTLLLFVGCGALLLGQAVGAESLWQKVLRITGISVTPSQQKAPGEEVKAGGAIWIANLVTGEVRKLSAQDGFHSPIFAPNDQTVLAIKNEALWQILLENGAATRIRELTGLTKLVGSDRDDPDKILVLLTRGPAVYSLRSGALSNISYDASSPDDRRMLTHLKGWERVYGATRVYPKTQSREGIAGMTEWQDVFLSKGESAPRNISRCDGDNCGQPSLSGDGTKVVFIRAKP
jgi:hypothetical protein